MLFLRDALKASFASTSPGAATHFIGLMLAKAIDVDLLHVPYKGGALALQDLLAGQIPVSINTIGEVLPQTKGGRVRVLATTGKQRSQFLPNTPTMIESGLQGMDIDVWVGIFVPGKTPPVKVRELAGWFDSVLDDAMLRRSLADSAMEPVRSNPDLFAATPTLHGGGQLLRLPASPLKNRPRREPLGMVSKTRVARRPEALTVKI